MNHLKKLVLVSVLFLLFVQLLSLVSPVATFAQEAPGGQPVAPAVNTRAGSPAASQFMFVTNTVMFFLVGFGAYYLMVVKPIQAKQTEQKRFIEGLKKNEEVVTTNGVLGRVAAVRPDFITVEVAPEIRIRVLPEHVLPYSPSSVSNSDRVGGDRGGGDRAGGEQRAAGEPRTGGQRSGGSTAGARSSGLSVGGAKR